LATYFTHVGFIHSFPGTLAPAFLLLRHPIKKAHIAR
jgi:hypothetical protein